MYMKLLRRSTVSLQQVRVTRVTHSNRLGGRRKWHFVFGTFVAEDVTAISTVVLKIKQLFKGHVNHSELCSRSFTFRLETEKFLLHCLQLTTSLSSAHCASRNTCCASFKSSTFNFDLQTAPFAHLFFTYGDVTKLEGGARLLAEMRAEVAQCQFLFLARFPNLIITRAKRFELLQTS